MSVGCEGGDITYNLKVDASQAIEGYSELLKAVNMYVALARRLNLPPEIDALIRKVLQANVAVNTLTRSVQLFYATSGPLGWALLIGGMALGGLMLIDTFEIRSPEY